VDVLKSVEELRHRIRGMRQRGCRIGCVPTMGALHAGHLSLVDECRKHVDDTIVTIFVNPTQFAPHEDLSKYPRPIEADLAACEQAGVNCVFLPDVATLYPEGFQSWVTVEGISSMLEGEFRPGHFRGVTTIVAKLFNLVQPDVACFGSKDYQQQAVIRQMVRDLDFPIEIITCPTIREPDGLAMSSRNVYLSPEERKTALALFRSLNIAESLLTSGERQIPTVEAAMQKELQSQPGIQIQYAVIRDPNTLSPIAVSQPIMVGLIAAFVGKTRLIDHLTIRIS